MECPFELPVKRKKDSLGTYYIVENRRDEAEIAYDLPKDQADYIVQVINCHEKFKTALRIIANGDADRMPNIAKQALKERKV